MKKSNLLRRVFPNQINKQYKQKSILLNIEIDDSCYLHFSLYYRNELVTSGKGRTVVDQPFLLSIKQLIDDYFVDETQTDLSQLQRQLSGITDDFLPKSIEDFLIEKKEDLPYLVIEDESINFCFPYGILFFPDSTISNCLTCHGFFLSEYYTIIRSKGSNDVESIINNMIIVSTEDLIGSRNEEVNICNYLSSRHNVQIHAPNNREEILQILSNNGPECLHFCCHGDNDCNIIFNKGGTEFKLPLDFFNLHRFPQGTIIILNICSSSYCKYDENIPRTISEKFIDRNSELVIATEWPIDDQFAYLLGTEFYKKIDQQMSAIEIVHSIKNSASTIEVSGVTIIPHF